MYTNRFGAMEVSNYCRRSTAAVYRSMKYERVDNFNPGAMKTGTGRSKDLIDIEELLKIQAQI